MNALPFEKCPLYFSSAYRKWCVAVIGCDTFTLTKQTVRIGTKISISLVIRSDNGASWKELFSRSMPNLYKQRNSIQSGHSFHHHIANRRTHTSTSRFIAKVIGFLCFHVIDLDEMKLAQIFISIVLCFVRAQCL